MPLIPTAASPSYQENPNALVRREWNFPVELLTMFIHHAAPDVAPTATEHRRRKRQLRRFALVDRAWWRAAKEETKHALYINLFEDDWRAAEFATPRLLAIETRTAIKKLNLYGARHLPAATAQVLFAELTGVKEYALKSMRQPSELLAGWTAHVRRMKLIDVNTPKVTGVFQHVTRLDLVGCYGECIPSSITDVHFPSLVTLVLDVHKKRINVEADSYKGKDWTPPQVKALALHGDDCEWMADMVARIDTLEHLHVGVSPSALVSILGAVHTELTSLSLVHGPRTRLTSLEFSWANLMSRHIDVVWRDARTALEKLVRVSVLAYGGNWNLHPTNWPARLATLIQEQHMAEVRDLELVTHDKHFKPLEWDPVNDESMPAVSQF
ncbi:hypothetical protein JCM10450v2_001920 [Rhodotorula kratochvilovae]